MAELDVAQAGDRRALPGLGQHLLAQVNAGHLALRADDAGGDLRVEARAAADAEDVPAELRLAQREGVADADEPPDGQRESPMSGPSGRR